MPEKKEKPDNPMSDENIIKNYNLDVSKIAGYSGHGMENQEAGIISLRCAYNASAPFTLNDALMYAPNYVKGKTKIAFVGKFVLIDYFFSPIKVELPKAVGRIDKKK